MQNELDIVRDISERLEQGGLAYMLTGSMAMNYIRWTRQLGLHNLWQECKASA